jgi:RNA polymerase sigma-70 factor (ECF subfamily)
MTADLVTRAQRGDQQAFGALAEQHCARLQRAAVGILRDPHVAEDATQNALVSVWRDLPKLRDPARFEGWYYRLLVRACCAEAKPRYRSSFTDRGCGDDEPGARRTRLPDVAVAEWCLHAWGLDWIFDIRPCWSRERFLVCWTYGHERERQECSRCARGNAWAGM